MSPQADYIVANGTGAAVRSDINGQLAAIVSNNSGATEPGTMYAYQWWADTTTGLLKIRNAANSAWISLRELDGTLTIEDGTAAAPGLAFTSDLNTGLLRVGADQLAITTGGTSRLAVSTTAVSSTLAVDVPLGAVATPSLTFTGDLNTGVFSPGADQVAITTGGTQRLNADTAAITSTLPVVHPLGAVGTPSITFTGDLNTGIWSPAADTIAFSEGGAEAMRIDSSGRLLVGTSTARSNVYYTTVATTPSVQFETSGSFYNGLSLINYSASGFSPVLTLGLSASNTPGTNTAIASTHDLGAINFAGNDGTNFRTGASIIATNDQASAWAVGDCPTRLVFSTTADGASSPTERMRITNAGHMLLATTAYGGTGLSFSSPEVSGIWSKTSATSGINHLRFENPNGVIGAISTNTSTTTFSTSSDYRLKENVTSVSDGITRLQQLKPCRFNFIADPDHTVDGFLAHEAQAVVPECVTGTKDEVDEKGNPVMQGIDQSKLVPLLTAALQEAIAKIEALETRLSAAGIA